MRVCVLWRQTSWTGSPLTWSDDGAVGAGCIAQSLKSNCAGWKEGARGQTDPISLKFCSRLYVLCFFSLVPSLFTNVIKPQWRLFKLWKQLNLSYQYDICHIGFLHQVKFICVAQSQWCSLSVQANITMEPKLLRRLLTCWCLTGIMFIMSIIVV